ncbi:signal peptide peptidase SppA [Halomontanus rarus]|uniref:signal peptide peptidase SppA n=1 Tax=Halomontanus rarus TaxID=3034020 RepID=UPI0023E7FB10|nr:signal peptide peptidase SppA [Halovivax sp. TS33]
MAGLDFIPKQVQRALIILLGTIVISSVGYVLFFRIPSTTVELAGIVLIVCSVGIGLKLLSDIATSIAPDYNVGVVDISGKIVDEASGPTSSGNASAKDIVSQINAADEDNHVRGLIVRINTGGGAIVPSDDIRRALEDFDGPTIAYALDVCASGGCWVASGCDEIWAREASMVGSIGVKFSQIRIDEFANKVGVNYESISTGGYKEMMTPFTELEEHERQHLQQIADTFHERFVHVISEQRDIDMERIEDSEARVYIGQEAVEFGLADEIGMIDDIHEHLQTVLDVDDIVVKEFEQESGLVSRVHGQMETLAYSFGAGLGSSVSNAEDMKFELR